jgi:hypothetical protein
MACRFSDMQAFPCCMVVLTWACRIRSPGSVWRIRSGRTRESEQVMKSRRLHLGKEMDVIALLGEDFVVKARVPFASCRVQGAVK